MVESGAATHGARLHRHAAEPLADHPLLHHLEGLGEGRVGIAGLDPVLVLDVPRRVRVELRRAGFRASQRVAHRRQRLPVDDHVGGGVGGEASVAAMTAATASPTWRTRSMASG